MYVSSTNAENAGMKIQQHLSKSSLAGNDPHESKKFRKGHNEFVYAEKHNEVARIFEAS